MSTIAITVIGVFNCKAVSSVAFMFFIRILRCMYRFANNEEMETVHQCELRDTMRVQDNDSNKIYWGRYVADNVRSII